MTVTELFSSSSEQDAMLTSAVHGMLKNIVPVYTSIPGASNSLIARVMNGLFEFELRTSPEQKKRWCLNVPRDLTDPTPDDGFIEKRNKEASDHKVYFHFRPELEPLLAAAGVTPDETHIEWLTHCQALYDACQEEARRFAKAFDAVSPGTSMFERVLASEHLENKSVLRLLKYDAGTLGFACPHYVRTYNREESESGRTRIQSVGKPREQSLGSRVLRESGGITMFRIPNSA